MRGGEACFLSTQQSKTETVQELRITTFALWTLVSVMEIELDEAEKVLVWNSATGTQLELLQIGENCLKSSSL